MPEAKTSKSHQPSFHGPSIGLSKESSEAAEPQEGHLLIVQDEEGRREFPLGGELYSLGRAPNSDIRLYSLFVSRRHATLVRRQREDGSYYYRIVDGDLKGHGSSNGIIINGRKLQANEAHDLQNEDEVMFDPRVTAKYYRLKRETGKSGPVDILDVTLIDPGMIDDSE
ncbi:MAG TPA: FHA domain-containing protein [Waterburya sp.]|jgi:pSer/pThr/pTyr-binding forkhead associated (FHA) protein